MQKFLVSFIPLVLISLIMNGCASSQSITEVPPTPISSSATSWQEDFNLSDCSMSTAGSNLYFILEPGFRLTLEGGSEILVITVLDETVEIDGIQTRVVEEKESKNGEIIEVSRNFFAFCEETKDVYYFGEEVDMYQDGILSSHSGAWRSGENSAKFGLIMPGRPTVGMRYYQELAPSIAMDRAEVISLTQELTTPAGTFSSSLMTKEGTALNPLEVEYKVYAPGIGLIQDANLLLTAYGYIDQ